MPTAFIPPNAQVPHLRRRACGFTFVELILVLFILALLSAIAIPVFGSMLKTTRVEETTKVVTSTLLRARAEAQRLRNAVSVFYGDDLSNSKVQPLAGVLPDYGHIEIWSVKCVNNGAAVDCTTDPWAPEFPYGVYGPYPFRFKLSPLTADPIVFPDGVRVIAGIFTTNYTNRPYLYDKQGLPPVRAFGYENNSKGPIGEIKRHQTTFDKSGRLAGTMHYYTDPYVLIFDVKSGEHRVVRCGDYTYGGTRPYVVALGTQRDPVAVNYIAPLSGYQAVLNASTQLNDFKQLNQMIDSVPNANYWNW